MRPIRKILVPTDFSPHAAEAFRQALGLAGPLGASVVVLHVARPPAVVVDGGQLSTDPTAASRRPLGRPPEAQGRGPGGRRRARGHRGRPADVSHILKILETAGCDLIVMGTHGLTG